MGTVLDLRSWQTATGEWSAGELRQLNTLFAQLPADPEREIVFGVTDAGDPWVAVLNGDEEVMLHVARIGGRIVIHAAEPDLVAEGPTLSSAAAHFVAAADFDRRATNSQSSHDTLPAHVLLSLGATLSTPALFEDHPALPAGPGLRFSPPTAESAVILAFTPPEDSPLARFAPAPDPAPALFAAPESSALSPLSTDAPPQTPLTAMIAPAAFVLAATPSLPLPEATVAAAAPAEFIPATGGETLIGGSGADTLIGGAGDDVLDGGGAPEGQVDLLDGGAGDDRLILRPDTVANGGQGDDVFAVANTVGQANPFESFGIVMDFFQSRGDRLEFAIGANVRIVGISSDTDILSSVRGESGGMQDAPVIVGARVLLDFNGDGKADGFVLLGAGRGQGLFVPDGAGAWRAGGGSAGGPYAPANSEPPPAPMFNTNAVGMEAQPMSPYGPAPVFTALQLGSDMFGARAAGYLDDGNLAGLLRPEDLQVAPMEAFG